MTRKIFKNKGKGKCVFSMEPCKESKELKKIIFKHGGVLFKKRKENSICLLPLEPGHQLNSFQKYPIYSYRFVYDSIAANKLLDLSKYELKGAEFKVATRSKYTHEDEKKMLDYVKRTFGNTKIPSFWEGLQKEGVNHSGESLRYHWKYVMPTELKAAAEKIMNENIKAEIINAQSSKNYREESSIHSDSLLFLNSLNKEDNFNSLSVRKKLNSLDNEKTPNTSKFIENQLKRKNLVQEKGQKALKLMNSNKSDFATQPLDKIIDQSNEKNHQQYYENSDILPNSMNCKQKIKAENEDDFTKQEVPQILNTSLRKEKTIEISETPKTEFLKSSVDKENCEPNFSFDANKIEENAYQLEIKREINWIHHSEQPNDIGYNQECIQPKIEMQNSKCNFQNFFFDKPEDLIIICDNQIRSVHYLKSLKHLCIDVNIKEIFAKLFRLCKKVSKRIISENDVLKALEARNGVVSDTISYFLDEKMTV